MERKIIKQAIGIFFLVLLMQVFFYYRGFYMPPETKVHATAYAVQEEQTIENFPDNYKQSNSTVLLDASHDNNFKPAEIESVLSRLGTRGAKIELLTDSNELSKKLSKAAAFIIISPKSAFKEAEILALKDFTKKNGKVALFVDPDREYTANALLTNFGIFAEYDYLYNMQNNEGNFRYIYVDKFKESELTKNLERVVFYNSCSLNSGDKALAFTDESTVSSVLLANASYSPVAFGGNLLAICDQTFLDNEFNSVQDNPKLITNIANWLTEGKKEFNLPDYPNFFNGETEILNDKDFLEASIALNAQLRNAERPTAIVSSLSKKNQIILALYDSSNLNSYANELGVIFDKAEDAKFSINGFVFAKENTAAVLFKKRDNGTYAMLVLADKKENLLKAVNSLSAEKLNSSLANDSFALITIA